MRDGYKRIDLQSVKIKEKPISSAEALKDVAPVPWKKEVVNGKEQAVISETSWSGKCVK